jgi:RimJ/RimL family protein N-acetyltransferase
MATGGPPERYRSDLVMIPLQTVGLNSPVARSAKAWIMSMTMKEDNEDGADFWDWIVSHYHWNLVAAGRLLDTYLFCDVNAGNLIATVSLVNDDRGVGRRYGISGIWMGGANVRKELRNRGVMTAALGQLHRFIQTDIDATGCEVAVNMFTGMPAAETIATKAGYSFERELEIEHFQTKERWYRKTFLPASQADG